MLLFLAEHGGGRMSRRMFYVGMKFCFQKAGSRHKDTGYTFVQWNAKVQFKRKSDHVQVQHLVALCRPVRTDSILELRLEGNMFISRHDLSFHFIYCDPRIINLIGYEPTDLIGRTAYQFHCPRDVLICKQCHKLLILSGSSKSDYYRFLSRSGKWVWLCTHATIVYDTTKKPQYVVCKNYVISEKEAREKLTQECQDFSDMKCLGFSLETDLPHLEHSPDKSLSHLDQQEEDGEALVHQLLSSRPVDVSDNPYARPRKKRNVPRVVGMGVSFPPGGAKNATFNADFRKDVIGHQGLNVSSHLDKLSSIDMLTSFDQLLTSQTQLDDANTLSLDSYTLPSSEDLAISFNDMLESSQTLQSIEESPVMTSDGQPNCDQLISGTLDSLDVPSLDQTFTSSFSGYGEFQPDLIDLMDYTPNVTESSMVTPSLDVTPSSEVMDYTPTTVYIKTTTNTFYRQPPGSISVLPQTFFMKSPSNDSSNFVSRHAPTKSQNLQSSSKLLSLLKSSDTIEMPAPKVSVTNIPETVAKAKSTVSILNDVFLSQDKKSQSERGLTAPSAGYRQSTFGHTDKNVTVSSNSLHESIGDVLFPNTASEDVMTDSHSDPFLSQLTDSSLYTDIMDEDLCPKDLTDMPMLSLTCMTDDQMPEKHDSSTVTLSSIGTTFSSSSMKELDSFLNIVSPSSDSMVPLNDSQTIPAAEKCSIASQPDLPPQGIKMAPMSWLSNESSSDSDNQGRDSDSQGRPSLLRSLLDKEGEVTQGPLTYKEWILEEALKKKNEFKRNRLSTRTSKHAANQRLRGSKCVRSTELPLPQSHASLFSKEMCQRKPTKELPLPPSAHRHKTPSSSQSSPTSSNEEMNLPDDLLDLAVEYCANLAPDQAEALLSDLNDTTSLEDNLYSLITSCPSQSKSLNTGGSKQISLLDSSQQSNNHLFSNASQPVSELAQPSKNLIGSTLGSSGHSVISVLSPPDGSVYKSSSGKDTNKMSLLRAAVTSPDVDKLIEQIPFGNIINFQQPPTDKKTDEPDVFITKVNGLQKMSVDESSQVNSVFKVPCLNNVRSPGKTSPSKAFQNSPLSTSDHIDAILFDHFYTASIATPHSPSAFINTSVESPGCVVSTRVQPESSPAPKVIFINRGTQGKAKSTPSSPRISPSGQCSPNSPRSTGASASDLSSTRPISVMIMKKENHRSRRSKSIGIQTDNEPGEVYPEFERSSTDTILYPSVSRISPKMPFLPSPSPSDTTSLSTSPTMSELEKFLRGFSSPEESCFSGEEDSQRRRGTPFLQKLLTGELSKDNYQRIDQQMLERERRESISSGCSDYDMN
nr:serine-rich adhesin for platelets-like [Biomphalaria glabrata]